MEAGLDAPPYFWGASEDEIAANYNGCGPEKFSKLQDEIVKVLTGTKSPDEELRKILTWIFELFELGFVIHDWDFKNSDNTETGFIESNHRLYTNMGRLLNAKYPVWNPLNWPKRAFWWLKMRLVYKAVSSSEGLRAWRD